MALSHLVLVEAVRNVLPPHGGVCVAAEEHRQCSCNRDEDRHAQLLAHGDWNLKGYSHRHAQLVTAVSKSFDQNPLRSEEHTSELPSLIRLSTAVFCLKK